MGGFSDIVKLLKPYKGYILLNVMFNVLTILLSLFSFASVAPFLQILFNSDEATKPVNPPELAFSSDAVLNWITYKVNVFIVDLGPGTTLLYFSGFIVVIFLLKNVMRYFALYNLAPVRMGVIRDLRQRVHEKILRLPLGYFSEERKGDIISRMTNDANEIEVSIISSLEMIFRDPITIIVYLGTMVFMSWKVTIFVLILLPVSGYLIGLIGKQLRGASHRGQSKLGEVLSLMEESLSGIRIIKAFNAEKQKNESFRERNETYFQVMTGLFRRQHLSSPLTETLSAIVMAVVIWYGGSVVLDTEQSGFTGAFFITFIVIFSQLIPPSKALSEAYYKSQKGMASVERINAILNADERIKEPDSPRELTGFEDSLEFKDVVFRYGEKDVLKGINLTIKKGQTVALVGPSGGGKSTLANLVPRFYDPVSGTISIDGIPLNECRTRDIRDLMGIVSQESILFNDSVENNIKLSNPNASDEEVERAAKIANAHDFITGLEQGYKTNVGDMGGKLSGGQKQRLSIARAVLKNPPILILDEATSALDTESEKLVQDALNKLMKNRTSLVIAHRLSTIQHADKIVVLEEGNIVEYGTHQELIELKGVYKRLCDLQSFA